VPAYARGRTSMEVLNLTQKLVERLIPPTPVAQPTAPPPQAQTQSFAVDPEGYVTGNQMLAAQRQAIEQYAPDVQAGISLAADANYGFVQQRYQKEFSKYGPEIAGYLAGVPKKMWTLDNLERVVKLVRADHLDDYRAEWQTEVQSRMEPTIRSGGAGGAVPVTQDKSNSLESEKIPVEWKSRAQKAGLTESTVREFCFANGMTEQAFYKQFETPTHAIVAEVQDGK
jgi:hypothetical protein